MKRQKKSCTSRSATERQETKAAFPMTISRPISWRASGCLPIKTASRMPKAQSGNRSRRKNAGMLRVGLISDTHGLLRPEATAFLRGSDFIVHGGDICDPRILEELAALAPVTAVRGNNDRGAWAESLRETEMLQIGEVCIYAIHDLAQLHIEPAAAGVRVVVSGHSHKPLVEERDGVLYVNPGSSGPRRFQRAGVALRRPAHSGHGRCRHLVGRIGACGRLLRRSTCPDDGHRDDGQ